MFCNWVHQGSYYFAVAVKILRHWPKNYLSANIVSDANIVIKIIKRKFMIFEKSSILAIRLILLMQTMLSTSSERSEKPIYIEWNHVKGAAQGLVGLKLAGMSYTYGKGAVYTGMLAIVLKNSDKNIKNIENISRISAKTFTVGCLGAGIGAYYCTKWSINNLSPLVKKILKNKN